MSLRARLIMLILIATLPAAAAIAWRGAAETEARTREAHQAMRQQSELLASELARILEGGRRLLTAVGKIPVVRDGSHADCTALLAEMQKAVEGSTFLGLYNRYGDVICGPLNVSTNNGDRPYFRRAIAKPGLAVGDYAIGRDSKLPTLHIAIAVSDPPETNVMVAGLDLRWIAKLLAERDVPAGTVFTVTDRYGTVLATTSTIDEKVGERLPEVRLRNVERTEAGSGTIVGSDGTERIVAFAPVIARDEKVLHVAVSVPKAPITARIQASVLREQAIQATSMLVALLLAWVVAERTIRSPVGKLLATVRAWGAGDLSKRAAFGNTRTELGELAGTLDTVGEELQRQRSELAQSSARIAAVNRQMHMVLEATTDSVVALDAAGRILFVNQNARAAIGTDGPVLGENLFELVPAAARPAFRARYDQVQQLREPMSFEAQNSDTSIWYEFHLHPTEDGVTIFFRDIGPRKQAEAALIAAKEQAEASSQAKSNFLATMSHELRTPLNAVIGFAEIIEGQVLGPLDAQYREYGEDIRRSGQHLLQVINDVLDISKIEAGRLTLDEDAADLDALVQACIRLVHGNAEDCGITLESIRTPGLYVRVDSLRLRQALLNLLSNAIKFSRSGGVVTVETRLTANDDIVIAVTDRGIGMTAEQVPIALTPFGQVESAYARNYEGTGLGLPIAQRLVEAHGGTLTIDTAPDVGTTVTITLPADRRVQIGAVA